METRFTNNIKQTENVQHRGTRMITEVILFLYSERLRWLNLITFKTRRIRGDLKEVFRIVKGFTDLIVDNFFVFNTNNHRGH